MQGLSLLWKAGFWVRINYLTVLGSSCYKCMEKFVDGINPIAHFYIFIIIVIISVLPLGNSAKPWSLVYNNLYLQSLCMDAVISSVLCYVSWQRFICVDTYTSIRLHLSLLRTLFPQSVNKKLFHECSYPWGRYLKETEELFFKCPY